MRADAGRALARAAAQAAGLRGPLLRRPSSRGWCAPAAEDPAEQLTELVVSSGLLGALTWTDYGRSEDGAWQSANQLLKAMRGLLRGDGGPQDARLRNRALGYLLRLSSLKHVRAVHAELHATGGAVGDAELRGLLEIYCTQGELEEALGAARQMKRRGLDPTAPEMAALAAAFARAGEIGKALDLIEDLLSKEQSNPAAVRAFRERLSGLQDDLLQGARTVDEWDRARVLVASTPEQVGHNSWMHRIALAPVRERRAVIDAICAEEELNYAGFKAAMSALAQLGDIPQVYLVHQQMLDSGFQEHVANRVLMDALRKQMRGPQIHSAPLNPALHSSKLLEQLGHTLQPWEEARFFRDDGAPPR